MSKRKGSAATLAWHAAPAAGADNNTRLAFLEEVVSNGVSALAGIGVSAESPDQVFTAAFDLLTTRDATIEAQGISIREAGEASKGLHERINVCTAKIEELSNLANGNEAEQLAAAIARAELAEADAKEARGDLEETLNERNAARNELQALKEGRPPEDVKPDEAPEPEAQAPSPARERPEAARDVGPTFAQGNAEDIATLIGEGTAELELAFSNGEHEIVAFGPQAIDAGVLVYRGRQFHVEPPLFIKGAGYSEQLHGVGLIANGDQIAYCEFPEPQAIEPGQERKLERMIVFG